MKNTSFKTVFFFIILLSLMSLCLPAGAQSEKPKGESYSYVTGSVRTTYRPITKVDLGVSLLNLNVGESYTFKVSYEPAEPAYTHLYWTVSDETVISVDPVTFTVKALKPGTARILAESFDRISYTWCDVIVQGRADESQQKAGSAMLNLSDAVRSKITAKSVLRHIEMMENASFSAQAYDSSMNRSFFVAADVKPGTEIAESQRALKLGMSKAEPLTALNAVNLEGTLEQILAFVDNNPDLKVLFELNDKFISDPYEDSTGLEGKATNLGNYVEALSSFSTAHNAGLKGANTTVAILDTGLNTTHEQFAGRIIAQHCFSTNGRYKEDRYVSVCSGAADESSDARPDAYIPAEFNHGTHVAGIAVGKDGVAPQASIVAVQIFSEKMWACRSSDPYYVPNLGECYTNTIVWHDEMSAYNWVINLQSSLPANQKISVVNMSYGGSQAVSDFCNTTSEYSYYARMNNAGMIPVIAAGNEGFDGAVSSPACVTNALIVGALYDRSTPTIAPFSNHSQRHIDILAPGTHIRSAFWAYEQGNSINNCNTGGNCYGIYSGTSMAAPMVSGAVALLHELYPNYTLNEMKTQLQGMSGKSANYRPAGREWNSSLTNPAKTFSFSKKVLDLSRVRPALTLTITDTNVRGKNREIQITIPRDLSAHYTKETYFIAVYNDSTNTLISKSEYEFKIRPDSTGRNWVASVIGNGIVNGTVYRFSIYKEVVENGVTLRSNTVTKYGMPIANVYGATVVAGNNTMVINTQHREPASGTRYMIFDGTTNTELAHKYGTKNNTVWTYNQLTNGKLYYAVAVPYRVYKNVYLWGPNQNRIYFIPMSPASNGRVSFPNSSSASVSIAQDTNANGIRVLYRLTGGSLQNGCESTGTSCTIRGLNWNNSYEFYAMKYKQASGKKYYSMGNVIPYNSSVSGLTAPQNTPVVAMNNSGYTTFTIKRSSNAAGISVLYREGEGNFAQACESSGNSCSTFLNTKKNYTFYIMQYRFVNGRRVYSPGIVARDFSSGKGPDEARLYTNFTEADESLYLAELYNALEDYYSENDLLMEEAMEVMGVGSFVETIGKDADLFQNEGISEEEIDLIPLSWDEVMEASAKEASAEETDVDEYTDESYSSVDVLNEAYTPEPENAVEPVGAEHGYNENDSLYIYHIGGDDDFYNGHVPSFGN